ncbi:MAG: ATP-binding protein [Desulfobacterales bacterium]
MKTLLKIKAFFKGTAKPLPIVVVYALFGVLWILFSDSLLNFFVQDITLYKQMQTYKGWFYVFITCVLLFYLVARYLNRLKLSLGELKREREFLSALLDNIKEAVVACDKEGKIVRFNEAARRLHGLSVQPIPPELWSEYFNLFEPDGITPLRKDDVPLFRALQGEDVYDAEIVVAPRQGHPHILVAGGQALKDDEGRITGAVIAMHDITERKRSQEELRIANEELLAINRIISTTATTIGIKKYLESVLDEVLAVTGLEGGIICLVKPDDTLHLAAHRETSEAIINDFTANVIKIGDCLCGLSVRDQKPLILPDRESVLKFATREAIRGEDIRFHAAFPLVAVAKCFGVICVFTRTDKKPMERSLKLLETVSPQIAVVLENIQLYEKTLRHAATLEEKVKERTDSLEMSRKTLMNVVEDLKEKSEALRKANEGLQELNRLKNIFLASMSHELRTPLNSIIGFTGILLMGMTGKLTEEQKNQLSMVKKSALHLLSLINDILDISKIEAGMMEPFPVEFDLIEIIQESMKNVSTAAEKKSLKFEYNLPDSLKFFSDRRRVAQIIINLVSNAVKFTEHGSVRVSVSVISDFGVRILSEGNEKPTKIEIRVTDSGIGIKKEDMNRLFFPFQQVDASLTKRFEGTGLGLYLSKKLANLLGGDITVKSEYGKGSEFVVVLPMRIGHGKIQIPNNREPENHHDPYSK